jgi:hypothetical protein
MTAWIIAVAWAQATVTVQTARAGLPVGHVLRTSDLVAVELRERDLPMGVVVDAATVAGRVVRVPMFTGELIRGEYLGATATAPSSLVPAGHWAMRASVRSDADALDLVVLSSGGFCAAARGVTVVLSDEGLIAIPESQLARALKGLGGDASVRRADPGLRDCR